MTTMRVVGECFFWYRLTRVFPDKFHRAVKRFCVCVCMFSHYKDWKGNTKCRNWGGLGVWGHPMSPFYRVHTTSYLILIETVSRLYHFRVGELFVKSCLFWPTPSASGANVEGDPVRILPRFLYGTVSMILRLAILTQYWHVTDGQTHHNSTYLASIASHGKRLRLDAANSVIGFLMNEIFRLQIVIHYQNLKENWITTLKH